MEEHFDAVCLLLYLNLVTQGFAFVRASKDRFLRRYRLKYKFTIYINEGGAL